MRKVEIYVVIALLVVVGSTVFYMFRKPSIPPMPLPQSIDQMQTPPTIINENRLETTSPQILTPGAQNPKG